MDKFNPAPMPPPPEEGTRALDAMPEALVLTGADMTILAANGLFRSLVGQPAQSDLLGQPLTRFLARAGPGQDPSPGHGPVHDFTTVAHTRAGDVDVTVTALATSAADGAWFGFCIRRCAKPAESTRSHPLVRSVEQLTDLVGRVPLKEIVRESTDLIERLCIEAALGYTADNRASAAEILGLSRQSLYSKLHRHGIGNLVTDGN